MVLGRFGVVVCAVCNPKLLMLRSMDVLVALACAGFKVEGLRRLGCCCAASDKPGLQENFFRTTRSRTVWRLGHTERGRQRLPRVPLSQSERQLASQ